MVARRNRLPSFDESRAYEEILRRDRRLTGEAQQALGEAAEGTMAGSALGAGMLASTLGEGGTGLAEAVEGSMAAGTALELDKMRASENARVLRELQGPERLAPARKQAEEGLADIEELVGKQQQAGSALATGAGLTGAALGSAAALMPQVVGSAGLMSNPMTMPLGIAGLLTSLFGGGAGAAIAGESNTKRRRQAAEKLREDVASFKPPSTRSFEQMLSAGPGYTGWEAPTIGTQTARRPTFEEQEQGQLPINPYWG